ncbi:MAG: hypothetical protein KAQ85_01075 [Thermodesulfovibrionia bacterium]|nr:hypothetical protein [Thermodesulfovibrionia bacterium]
MSTSASISPSSSASASPSPSLEVEDWTPEGYVGLIDMNGYLGESL